MYFTPESHERPVRLRRHILVLTCIWTLVIGLSIFVGVEHSRDEIEENARFQAEIIYDRILVDIQRMVKSGEAGATSEGLGHLAKELRNLSIYDHDAQASRSHVQTRLVSVTPIDPQNRADEWEREALARSDQSRSQDWIIATRSGNGEHYRLLRPLRLDTACQKCHGGPRKAPGSIQGGVSVQIPRQALWMMEQRQIFAQITGHAVIWLVGLGGLWAMARSLRERFREREWSRRLLQRERDFIAAVIDTAGAMVLVLDGKGRIVRFNRTCERVTGLEAGEVLGQAIWDLPGLPAEDREWARAMLLAPREWKLPEAPVEREGGYLTRAGEKRRITWSITLRAGENGEIEHVIATGLDMTERQKMQECQRVSEEKFRNLFENCNDAILIAEGASGTIVDANPAAAALMGTARESLIGMNQARLHPPEEASRYQQYFASHLEKSCTLLEGEVLRADGRRVPVELSASTFTLEGKAMVQGVFRDVSERKRSEEERQQFEEKIQQAQKLESLGVLAGGIAHDFNNLLMGVLGYADLALVEMPAESPARRSVEQIVTAAMRAADLTRQMLAYSGKGRFVIEALDLTRLVEEMIHLLEVSISKKAMLRFNFTENPPPIEGDATQIRQVIMNLITNASDAIGEKSGVITINTGVMEVDRTYLQSTYMDDHLPEGFYTYVEVSDTGCGMDAETRSRIFDPFFTTKFTGRGLGLAAVLGIVRGHKGGIKVYSEPGRGTTFKVLLPCRMDTAADQAAAAPEAGTAWRGSGTVLVVDDEETVRAVSKMTLETAGFQVMTAADGCEALEIFRAMCEKIDLVLLDMTMPHMNGEETFRELRRLRGNVRIVLSSGYNEQEATHRFAGKGLSGFIQKPYRSRELIEKVALLIDGHETAGTGRRL